MPADQIGTAVTEGLLKDLDVAEDLQAQYTDAAMLSQIVDATRADSHSCRLSLYFEPANVLCLFVSIMINV